MEEQIVIVEQIDPERLTPGGTDTCILDMVKFAPDGSISIVGVTASEQMDLGRWTPVPLAGKTVRFLPVARMERRRVKGAIRVPDSFRLAVGIVRHLKEFSRAASNAVFHSHRVEVGALLSLLVPKTTMVQFLHNDSAGLLGKDSDSVWRRLPLIYRLLERVALWGADAAVLFSVDDSLRVRRIFPDVQPTETWFDEGVFYPPAEGRSGDGIKVLTVGRLESQKDPILALRTFKALCAKKPDSSMRIIGSGSLERDIVHEIQRLELSSKVALIGSLNVSGVAEAMREADVLLMTSHYEGSPRVVVEAGACGLPIACTKAADPDGVVENGRNGWVSENRTAEALSAAIIRASKASPADCYAAVCHRAASRMVPPLLKLGVTAG